MKKRILLAVLLILLPGCSAHLSLIESECKWAIQSICPPKSKQCPCRHHQGAKPCGNIDSRN